MSDTPRTDAMIQAVPGKDCVTGEPIEVVHADDCRALELDLAACKETWAESNRCYLEQFDRAERLQRQMDAMNNRATKEE